MKAVPIGVEAFGHLVDAEVGHEGLVVNLQRPGNSSRNDSEEIAWDHFDALHVRLPPADGDVGALSEVDVISDQLVRPFGEMNSGMIAGVVVVVCVCVFFFFFDMLLF